MHETIIAQKIIEDAKKHGEIKSAVIEVGEIAHITAKELKETLTDMVSWSITVTEKKAKVKCSCGYEGEPKIIERKHDLVYFECPECGKVPSVLEGSQIILKEVEV
jgi:Zn finger protein HypA/HybF involved in hydrogenase expression|tara:strand:- start:1145 stop:1462 length:318 start_codon:yes stop_codon:yes gene_type:complete